MNKDLQSEQQISMLESVDTITENLIKARAVLGLVQDGGKDSKSGFCLDHQTIMNSLWCVDDLLRDAEQSLGSL